MKKSIVLLIHLGYWVCYILIITLIAAAGTQGFKSGPEYTDLIKRFLAGALIPGVLGFYSHHSLLFERFLKPKRFLPLISFSLICSVISSILGIGVMILEYDFAFVTQGGPGAVLGIFLFIALIALLNGSLGLLFKGFITWYEEIQLKQELTEKNHAMELALVKAQIDPHFLFNTINNIDVLIQKTPEAASNYLNKLSEIMRFMLFETKQEKVTLSEEINYLTKYIDLQKIRSSNPKYVNLEVTGDTDHLKIAPMVLIPFVENAFKHSGNKKMENAIKINIAVKDTQIMFKCINTIGQISSNDPKRNGIGHSLIQQRLQLLYPGTHSLTVSSNSNTYEINLVINEN